MPMREVQGTLALSRRYALVGLGDSLTFNSGTLLCPSHQMWVEAAATKLRALGCGVRSRNWGVSGDTTTLMLARQSVMYTYEVPTIGVIWGGINDPGNSIVGATTQSNIQTMAQALINKGCTKVVVMNTPYLNYLSGGDTKGTPYATYATLRPFQAAAAAANYTAGPNGVGQVVLSDTYTYMRNLIGAGNYVYNGVTYTFTDLAASSPAYTYGQSWHVADQNQHLNALGMDIVASSVVATIQAAGWVSALQS